MEPTHGQLIKKNVGPTETLVALKSARGQEPAQNSQEIDPSEAESLPGGKKTGTISDDKGTRMYKNGKMYHRNWLDGKSEDYDEEGNVESSTTKPNEPPTVLTQKPESKSVTEMKKIMNQVSEQVKKEKIKKLIEKEKALAEAIRKLEEQINSLPDEE